FILFHFTDTYYTNIYFLSLHDALPIFQTVKNLVNEFSEVVKNKSNELNSELNQKIESLKVELQKWSEKEKEIQEKIDLKKAQFEQQGIPFDLGKINQISKDILDYQKKIEKLDKDKIVLKSDQEERIEIIKKRLSIKEHILSIRKEFSKKANENLKNTIEGFFITIKYKSGLYSTEFEELLKQKMDWRQNKKSKLISNNFSVFEFLEICKNNNVDKLKEIKDDNENYIFSESEENL